MGNLDADIHEGRVWIAKLAEIWGRDDPAFDVEPLVRQALDTYREEELELVQRRRRLGPQANAFYTMPYGTMPTRDAVAALALRDPKFAMSAVDLLGGSAPELEGALWSVVFTPSSPANGEELPGLVSRVLGLLSYIQGAVDERGRHAWRRLIATAPNHENALALASRYRGSCDAQLLQILVEHAHHDGVRAAAARTIATTGDSDGARVQLRAWRERFPGDVVVLQALAELGDAQAVAALPLRTWDAQLRNSAGALTESTAGRARLTAALQDASTDFEVKMEIMAAIGHDVELRILCEDGEWLERTRRHRDANAAHAELQSLIDDQTAAGFAPEA